MSTTKSSTAALTLAAIGVVYGDIGTSPIYAFREALHASSQTGVATREDIFGVLSLIVWALVFGWFVFGDWPTPAMLCGAALIVAAGLTLLVLERRAAPAPYAVPPMKTAR